MANQDVVLVGHSFIRRLRDDLIVPENRQKTGRDISVSRGHLAIAAAS